MIRACALFPAVGQPALDDQHVQTPFQRQRLSRKPAISINVGDEWLHNLAGFFGQLSYHAAGFVQSKDSGPGRLSVFTVLACSLAQGFAGLGLVQNVVHNLEREPDLSFHRRDSFGPIRWPRQIRAQPPT